MRSSRPAGRLSPPTARRTPSLSPAKPGDDVLVSRRLASERYELVASPLADIGRHLGEAATVIAPAAIWRRVVDRASTILEA